MAASLRERRMWMRIGQQVKLIAPMQNQCRTILGAIEINSGEGFHRPYSRKRTVEMISYREDLLVHYAGRPGLLILDHASLHKSRLLRAWLAEHAQIELLYLPKYAAHRDNPIEKRWWHLKGYAAANRCCRSMSELLEVVERYFNQLIGARGRHVITRHNATVWREQRCGLAPSCLYC
jgi:transposase